MAKKPQERLGIMLERTTPPPGSAKTGGLLWIALALFLALMIYFSGKHWRHSEESAGNEPSETVQAPPPPQSKSPAIPSAAPAVRSVPTPIPPQIAPSPEPGPAASGSLPQNVTLVK